MLSTLKKRVSTAALLSLLTLHSAFAAAQPDNSKQRSGPPPEAIAACAEAQQDDSCSFSGRRGEELEGSCIAPPHENDQLVCAPEGMRPPAV